MTAELGADHPATNRARTIKARILLDLDRTDESMSLLTDSLSGLLPLWEADAFLWKAEIALRQGDKLTAGNSAKQAVSLRKALPIFTPWQISEAEFIQALAQSHDEKATNAAQAILAKLPAAHSKYKESKQYLESLQ